jgi:hypothetical protein
MAHSPAAFWSEKEDSAATSKCFFRTCTYLAPPDRHQFVKLLDVVNLAPEIKALPVLQLTLSLSQTAIGSNNVMVE